MKDATTSRFIMDVSGQVKQIGWRVTCRGLCIGFNRDSNARYTLIVVNLALAMSCKLSVLVLHFL